MRGCRFQNSISTVKVSCHNMEKHSIGNDDRLVNTRNQKMEEKVMFINKAADGTNNICGKKIRKLRKAMPGKVSQRMFAEMLHLHGMDVNKNVVSRIENGERFVTDMELRIIREVLQVSFDELME